jgi:hypothetical protein
MRQRKAHPTTKMLVHMKEILIAVYICLHVYYCTAFSFNGSHADRSRPGASELICKYTNGDEEQPIQKRHVPRRAMPHIQTSSSAEAATKAGYIIRSRGGGVASTTGAARDRSRTKEEERRPLRTIRRIVHRSDKKKFHTTAPNLEEETIFQDERRTVDSSLMKDRKTNKPQAQRVTFKATQVASRSLSYTSSMERATLTEYMTQPVEDYSLLSFHDEEDSSSQSSANQKEVTKRRWFVRRLTHEEASRYIIDPISSPTSKDELCSPVKESNLFRLAVPLQALIGWDLTPVIDLEVVPPEVVETSCLNEHSPSSSTDEGSRGDVEVPQWGGFRQIRARQRRHGDGTTHSPTVKIRSMSVSLLSTKEEVRQAMSKPFTITAKDKKMQGEAIGMVGKVEEWLKPHITFEAELAWQDGTKTSSPSLVTVKSSAVTSLTIPKISNEILRATVPSAFLVKRLGATLTSKALEICLPRFLRQLERDFYRWSGIEEKL